MTKFLSSNSESQLGSTLAGGKYKILNQVGAGSMGQVYRAEHTALGRTVAIKILLSSMNSDNHAEARFLREARAASKLQHPSSMQVLDFGSEDGVFYLVMEFLDGHNLAHLIDEEAPLETGRIALLMSQVLGALAAAHEQGVIHRDLKPENIILIKQLSDDGIPVESLKVCDFGIAKIQSKSEHDTDNNNTLTQEGTVSGTPSYMAPEQCRGISIDARADIYSCGVILYEMATGQVPFEADNPIGLMMQHITDVPPNPRDVNGNVHPELDRIISKCLMKKPIERYPTARSLRDDLKLLFAPGAGQYASMIPGAVVGLNSSGSFPPYRNGQQRSSALTSHESQGGAYSPIGMPPRQVAGAMNVSSSPFETEHKSVQSSTTPWDIPDETAVMRWRHKVSPIVIVSALTVSLLAFGALYGGGFGSDSKDESSVAPSRLSAGEEGSQMVSPRDNSAEDPLAVDSKNDSNQGASPNISGVELSQSDNGDDGMGPSTSPPQRPIKRRTLPKRGAAMRGVSAAHATGADDQTAGDEPEAPPAVNKSVPEQEHPATENRERREGEGTLETVPDVPAPQPKTAPTALPPKEKKIPKLAFSPALGVSVSLTDLVVRGSLPIGPVRIGVMKVTEEWQDCYQRAAESAGKNARVALYVKLMIDEDGRARAPSVSKSPLPRLSSCVSKAANKIRSRTRPDTGTVQVGFKLMFVPKLPKR